MKRIFLLMLWLNATVYSPTVSYGAAAAETAGQDPGEVEQAAAGPTAKVLIEKAGGEGQVSFYSSLQAQQIDPFIQLFRKRYPFINVNPYRVSGNRQVLRIQTEMNAGNHLFNVTNGSAEQAAALKKIGAIDPYFSPQRDFFPASSKDKDGFFSSLYVIPIVLGYNTNLVKRPDAPKSYEDLLHPRWKSNMFLDDEAYELYAYCSSTLVATKDFST